MKIIAKALITCLALLTLSACGSSGKEEASESSSTVSESSTSETVTSTSTIESTSENIESESVEETSSSEVVEEVSSEESKPYSLDELDTTLNSFVDILNQNTTEAGFGDIIVDFYRVDPEGTTPRYIVDLSPDSTAFSNLEIKSYVTMICETFVTAADQVDEVPMLEYYISGLKIGESGMSLFGDPYEVEFENLD